MVISGYLGKRSSILRLKTAIRTDERVRLMNEIISGIQVIKMYTWEKPFAYLVSLARKNEIKQIRSTSFIRGTIGSFIMFTTRISIFISVLAYVLLGGYITAEQVFVLTSYYNILRQTMTVFFPQGIALVAEAMVSVKRLQKFLMYDETQLAIEYKIEERDRKMQNKLIAKQDKSNGTFIPHETKLNGSDLIKKEDTPGVFMKNASAKWIPESTEYTLSKVTLRATPGKLIAVIGPVGAGKSSLLHAILKELPLTQGSIEVVGKVSYASQEPWLFAGSVRQNILFGLPMDKHHYKTVIRNCSLERDFTLLPYADKTIVGERGISLSGGQRARINLARAIYKEADIYLLDDPLSAVDTHVGKELFENCIKGYLQGKTVILITHQLQYLKAADHIIILNAGAIQAEGTYSDLKASGLDFAKLLDDHPPQPDSEEELQMKVVHQRQNSVHSVNSIEDKTIEAPEEIQEQKSIGHVAAGVYKAYLTAGGNCCFIFFMYLLFIFAQFAASAGDYFITYW